MQKARFGMYCGFLFILFSLGTKHFLGEVSSNDEQLKYLDETFTSANQVNFERGRIVYYSKNIEVCNSNYLIPGIALMPRGFLAIAYGSFLIYLFMGIGIISDIFMESIEKITARKETLRVLDQHGEVLRTKQIDFWNPTVANLTLMALGSSAPEILLSVIETLGGLGKCPGELGASTIVGSAAFNLLVICGVSIYAVGEENDTAEDRDTSTPDGVKKINDMGVFAITCTFSLWAYIWLFICVRDSGVEVFEAVLTFIFFWVLIGLAYLADTCNKGKGDDEEEEELNKHEFVEFSTVEIYRTLIEEKKNPNMNQSLEHKQKIDKMKKFLKETMNTDEIDRIELKDLKEAVEGKSMLSRVQYRK
jgi:Ca2+/Na+ antiporter